MLRLIMIVMFLLVTSLPAHAQRPLLPQPQSPAPSLAPEPVLVPSVQAMMAVPSATRPPPLLAVLEFDSPEQVLTDGELQTLTDALRSAVKKEVGARYKVLTRETMTEIVPPEQLKCFVGKCVAEIGRMLQAPYIIAGNVRAFGSKKVLTVEAYESNGGQLLGSEQLKGADAEVLLDQLDEKARGLVRSWLSLGPAARATPVATETQLGGVKDLALDDGEEVIATFESEPIGAVVMLDGRMLCRATPCQKTVASGSHEVSMSLEQYDDTAQTVSVSKAQKRVRLVLAANFGTLRIEANEKGVPVRIDGRPVGETPLETRLDVGTHDVLIGDRCWQEVGQRVVVEKGKSRTLALEAVPRWAGLKVSAEDETGNDVEAEVSVDGKGYGTTPVSAKVPVCAKEIVLKASSDREWKQALVLKEGERQSLRGKVERQGPPSFESGGLTWMASPAPTKMSWIDARAYCARMEWRLPSKDDLLALFEAKKSSPALGRYDGMDEGWFWSSTPWSEASFSAWLVHFGNGVAGSDAVRSTLRVRCVR